MNDTPAADLETINWADWYRRWERQQGSYIAEREARFAAMFSAVAHLVGDVLGDARRVGLEHLGGLLGDLRHRPVHVGPFEADLGGLSLHGVRVPE